MTDRRALYAKTSIAVKDLRIDDEDFRAMLSDRYGGKTSRKDLTDRELVDLMDHLKSLGFEAKPSRDKKNRADGEANGKIRALWISLYWLGVINDRSDNALDAFVERQAKVSKLRFLPGSKASPVIDALKAWAARPLASRGGGVDWTEHANARVCVARAQWRRLAAIGAVRVANLDGLDAWLQWKVAPHKTGLTLLDDGQLDETIRRLGVRLRKELLRATGGTAAADTNERAAS